MQAIAEQTTDRKLYRVIDLYAADAAAAALRTAAARAGDGVLARAAAVLADPDDEPARDRLRAAVAAPQFLASLPAWIRELREAASASPETGACTVATALRLWLWTTKHFLAGEASDAVDELALVLPSLLAARCLALDAGSGDGLRAHLGHVYAAHASAAAGAACAELVFGYRRHLVWDAEGCATCYDGDDLDELEAVIPGIACGARMFGDVIEGDGSHPAKAGPCAKFDGLDTFMRLRRRLDGCLTGARIAKDRAAAIIARRA
jgi:hypothetical protein